MSILRDLINFRRNAEIAKYAPRAVSEMRFLLDVRRCYNTHLGGAIYDSVNFDLERFVNAFDQTIHPEKRWE